MQKLTCEKCGTQFNCGSTPTHSCWCMKLPNMSQQFDLAGSCVCPDCLTQGKSNAITKQRKARAKQRQQERDLLR